MNIFNRLTLKTGLLSVTLLISLLSFSIYAEEQSATQPAFVSFQVTGKGSPILLIPGLMSDASVWAETADALKDQYQVHIASVAGFAKTPAARNISLDKISHQLARYLREKKLVNTVVIGHSMGAFLAYKLALSQPDRVSKVIAVDGLPFLAPIFTRTNSTQVQDALPYAKQIQQQYQNMNQQQLLAISKSGVAIQATSKVSQQRVLDMVAKSDPTTVGTMIYQLMTTDLRANIADIKAPILLLGASGGFTTDTQHKQVKQLYTEQMQSAKDATVTMNTQARHFIMFDDLPWLVTQIKQFIARG